MISSQKIKVMANIAGIGLIMVLLSFMLFKFFLKEEPGLPSSKKEKTPIKTSITKADAQSVFNTAFNTAVMLKKKGRDEEAISKFREAIEENPGSILADNAHYQIVKCLNTKKMKRYEEAITECRSILNDYPESEVADDAQYLIARTLHRQLGRNREALSAYKKFLARFPESRYAPEVKNIVETLGSDPDGDGLTVAESMDRGMPDEEEETVEDDEEEKE